MRLPFSGLRAGILTQLIFLIIAAMLLVNVAMMKLSERDLIQAKVETGRLLVRAVEQKASDLLINKEMQYNRLDSDLRFKKDVINLVEMSGFSALSIIDYKGELSFSIGQGESAREYGISLAREAISTGEWSINYSGSTLGVIWLNKKNIIISAPIAFENRPSGGIAVSSSLASIYDQQRRSEKVILLYILLDTVILAIVGIYILSRIVIRPIHKLLKMTDDYQEGDFIPSFAESSKNEIGNLSRSLSVMLKRLDDNKGELRAYIYSLEKANNELKKAQDEIIRSEKLASIGRLSAGIAHEIGNPLGIILGYLDLIRRGDIEEEEKRDFLDRVESEITRVKVIIKQLLDFSRPSTGRPEKSHVHELIMDTVKMLKPQPMMEDVRIVFEMKASRDEVFTDPGQLQQVFLNIIINAADALSEKGLASQEKGHDKIITIKSEDSGEMIEIGFMDNGPGVTDEELKHIFDPFYTTKEPGKGTGLGLSVSYRIIEKHGGSISATSTKGYGTNIIVRLPIYGQPDEHVQ